MPLGDWMVWPVSESRRSRLPITVTSELRRLYMEGATTRQIRLSLAANGMRISERSINRYQQDARDEQRRARDLESIGRGLGSVRIGAAGAAEILRECAPGWRAKQAGVLGDLLQQFLKHPTSELYAGLATGLYSFLLSCSLSEIVEGSRE